jgi:hypothetical protein
LGAPCLHFDCDSHTTNFIFSLILLSHPGGQEQTKQKKLTSKRKRKKEMKGGIKSRKEKKKEVRIIICHFLVF